MNSGRRLDPGIQVAQLPAGPVVRMEPIPDGSTYAQAVPYQSQAYQGSSLAAPVQLASADGGPVVRMDPIPDGSTSGGASRLAESETRSVAPTPSLPTPALAPPRAAAPASVLGARGNARRTVLASAQAAPAPSPRLAPPAQPMLVHGFSGLVGTAHASSLPASLRANSARPAPVPGAWAVQVGAFASQNLARTAAHAAREAGGGPTARALVQPVASGRSTLYRARVTGLSQPAAQAVCDRLRRNGACMVLSPDAQG